ncbi:MAG TPA: TIM barrel protein [Geminicoccaceae bacterium]|nr:TIM barrel protein [Geminicoccaceae bacterium]
MKRAIATVCMSGTLADKLAAAAEAGFTGVEIFENDLTYFPGKPEDAHDLAGSLGLELVALQPFRDFEGLPEPLRTRAFDRAKRKFELMSRLGTSLLLVCSSVSPDAVDDLGRVAADLHELGELAEAHGVAVGFEALCWGRHIFDYRQAWEAVRRADHASVGLILDTFHALARGCPIEPIADIPPERIVLAQTADAPGIEMDLLFLSRHYRCFPGQGDLPVVAMVRQLAEIGYRGPISHEIFSDDFRATSARQAAIDGMRSFLWLDEQLNSSPRANTAPVIDGIEFVEFVDDAGHADAFRGLLETLGFRRTHRHRSKQVELHRQGDANVVLNLEDEGFPYAFQLLHGLSVAALALRVDDAQRAARRAADLLAKPFSGPIGAGELAIPAVRGVGGSLLYFVDRRNAPGPFHEVDFVPDADGTGDAGLGLIGIDHVAQVVPQTEFLSWILYYRALLGLEPEARTDLADPRGLIVSRAMTNPARTLRLPLNASQAQASSAGRFMERTAGAGAQHIAFACQDIFAAAARLPAELRLPVPANYYDDIAARFDLGAGMVEQLQAHSILFDRIGAGEFFHVFTRTTNGVFFELLERRGGYDRYGEANAPVRLAAQAALEQSLAERLTAARG